MTGWRADELIAISAAETVQVAPDYMRRIVGPAAVATTLRLQPVASPRQKTDSDELDLIA
jgi:hypothetical protein